MRDEKMKFLSSLVVMFLLMGCTTTNFVVSDELADLCNNCKSIEKAEVVSVEPIPTPTPVPNQLMNLPLQMLQQGWSQSSKNVLCGPPDQVIRSVKKWGEKPYMYWQDPRLKITIMLFRNKERDSLTVVENVNPQKTCVISTGVQLHIEDISAENSKLH